MDRYGFSRTTAKKHKHVQGFQAGDMVKAIVTTGKKAGTYTGRVAVRSTGSFNITSPRGTLQGISYRHCVLLHKSDGYAYSFQKGEALPPFG